MSEDAKKPGIPIEAAKIMARMVRMPPKPHEEMKFGNKKPDRKPTTARGAHSGKDADAKEFGRNIAN